MGDEESWFKVQGLYADYADYADQDFLCASAPLRLKIPSYRHKVNSFVKPKTTPAR